MRAPEINNRQRPNTELTPEQERMLIAAENANLGDLYCALTQLYVSLNTPREVNLPKGGGNHYESLNNEYVINSDNHTLVVIPPPIMNKI